MADMLIDFMEKTRAPGSTEKVVELASPEEISAAIDFEIGDTAKPFDELLDDCKNILRFSTVTSHPRFFNQLFASADAPSIAGEWMTAVSNASMYTFEVAPSYMVLESTILEKLRTLCGWTNGDGIFCPGGSISNFYGINMARFKALPNVKSEGMFGQPTLKMFVSAHAHYSFKKGAAFLGIGIDNLVEIPTDSEGRMRVDLLEAAIEKEIEAGNKPFFVAGTSGTTVMGAYDDLNGIADVCEKHNLWMHVDGAWGGSVRVSPTHKSKMDGIERADSLTWNPHKMMGVPLQCSAFILQDPKIMNRAHSASAEYLFQQDKLYADLDSGDKSIQCGRKVDALKLWLSWKALGDQGFAERIDHAFYNSQYLAEQVTLRPEAFRLLAQPQCTNVCFEFIPPSARSLDKSSDEYKAALDRAPAIIKARMQKSGSMMCGYQRLDGSPNFFRMIVISPTTSSSDMDFVLDEIESLGADL